MPVYNGGKYIEEALNSLLGQTFSDFELIISDNASNDETEAICRVYASKDSRIRYVRQARNLGAVYNFQFVLNEAVSTYFMWAAADDKWHKSWVDVLLPIAASNHCLAFGTVHSIQEDGLSLGHPANQRSFEFSGNPTLRRMKYYLEPGFLGKANPIYGIFPKDIIGSDFFDILKSKAGAGDMLMLYEILRHHAIKCNKTVFLYKRIHDNCAGGGMTIPLKSSSFLKRLIDFFTYQLTAQSPTGYWGISSPLERFFLILFNPFLVIRASVTSVYIRALSNKNNST